MYREDFEMLSDDIIYFDNGATTLKPRFMMKEIEDYYNKYTANSHRGSYNNSIIVDAKYEYTRGVVKDFINAEQKEEIIFTSGTTDSLNKIIFGFFDNYLKDGDEVLVTESEHASNILPWFNLKNKRKIAINYIPLDIDYNVTLENIKKVITDKTKAISIAFVTNVIGDIRPIKEIIKYAHEKNIIVLIDGAQAAPHLKIDVRDLDIDFLAFSAHKMCGPTGVGILYGKYELLEKMSPIILGGGMNKNFDYDGNMEYAPIPYCFEAGTPNIAGVIAFAGIIEYLNEIGLDNIHNYELELKKYAIYKLKQNKDIIIHNENSDSAIITFNHKSIDSATLSDYLNYYNICIRSGSHCAKIINNEFKMGDTCRISLYFYNTKEEIDKFCEILSNLYY